MPKPCSDFSSWNAHGRATQFRVTSAFLNALKDLIQFCESSHLDDLAFHRSPCNHVPTTLITLNLTRNHRMSQEHLFFCIISQSSAGTPHPSVISILVVAPAPVPAAPSAAAVPRATALAAAATAAAASPGARAVAAWGWAARAAASFGARWCCWKQLGRTSPAGGGFFGI